jgi:hypothetical protein
VLTQLLIPRPRSTIDPAVLALLATQALSVQHWIAQMNVPVPIHQRSMSGSLVHVQALTLQELVP